MVLSLKWYSAIQVRKCLLMFAPTGASSIQIKQTYILTYTSIDWLVLDHGRGRI